MKQFILGEDTKTLFMLNYAFVNRKLRHKDPSWISSVILYKEGKLSGSSELAKNVKSRVRQQGYLFDLQDLAI